MKLMNSIAMKLIAMKLIGMKLIKNIAKKLMKLGIGMPQKLIAKHWNETDSKQQKLPILSY